MTRRIFTNGNIITVDQMNERAQALAVEDGHFLAVGSNEEVLQLNSTNCEIIDLNGKTVVPGFNDSHMHLLSLGAAQEMVDLTGVCSAKEIIERGTAFLNENPNLTWLLGRGWNHETFSTKQLPSRADLDQISTDIPILFTRVCGHVSVANTKALEMADILTDVQQPKGGRIDVDIDGVATGILRERAAGLVSRLIPAKTLEDYKRLLRKGSELALSLGLTTVQTDDMGGTTTMPEKLQAYQELVEEGKLPLRISLQIRLSEPSEIDEYLDIRDRYVFPTHTVEYGPLKLMTDGSLGGRTAAMQEPYADDPTTCGVAIMEQEEISEMFSLGHQKGLQVSGHAIGDQAIQMLLNGFRKMLAEKPADDARPRIIHAQLTNETLLQQMQELGVVCDIQPIFVGTDMHFVESRLGVERASVTYPWKTMREKDIATAGGSDAPVESCNPLWGLYTAVTRQDLTGYPEGGWTPQEKLTIEEALELFTMGSAYASFDEDIKGSISQGKLADFVVLSDDITAIKPTEIKDVSVMATYIGGQEVYRAE